MADNRYVVIDYVESGYDEVQNTAWYIESGYFELGYVIQGITQSGEAAVSAAFAISATGDRFRASSLTVTATATFTAEAVKVFGADATLTATTTFTAEAAKLFGAELTAFNNISLTAEAVKLFGASVAVNSDTTLTATALKIQPGAADFTAFNTVVTAAGRIRPAVDITALAATLTASPTKVFGASTNTIDYYNDNQFGEAGFRPQSGNNVGIGYLNYRAIVGDDNTLSGSFDGTTFSFYARADVGGTSGTIAYITTLFNRGPVRIGLSGGAETGSALLVFDKPTGGGSFIWNLDALLNTPTYDFTVTRLHHYYIHIGAWNWPQANTSDRVVVVDAWVDGVHLGQQSYFTGDTSNPYYMDPDLLYVGSDNAGNNRWQGTLAQFWVSGYDSLASNYLQLLTPTTYESFGANGKKNGTLGNGFGSTATGTGPLYYIEGGRYNDSYPLEPGDFLTTNPLDTSYPLQGNFTLTPTAFKLIYGEAALTSAFSIVGVLGKLQPSSIAVESASTFSATAYDFTKAAATLNIEATLSAEAYDFTKGTANLASEFSLSADADETSTGVSLVLATATIAVSASVIRRTSVTMLSTVECSGDATTNQLGRCLITSTATLSATPYDFTKGTVSAQAVLSIEATARIFSPPRGTLLSGMLFTLTATPLKLRIQTSTMQSSAALLVADGGAVRNANISMSAFNAVLSAGKIIEFLAEHIITVTEEQRLLKVALESTVLLVQMANGVNSVMAETTDIVVAQEQGVLLAQYNTPTN